MLVYFTIILTVLLGFCGLAIDVGRMELRTNQLQAAADAGALAGANELAHGGSGSVWQTAADNDIATVEAANGIPNTGTGAAVWSATYGPYTGDYSTVQVNVTQKFPTIFLGLLTKANASVTLSVKAIAQIPPCMFFLGNPALSAGYDFWNASAGFDAVSGCPVYSRYGVVVDGFSHMSGSQIRSSTGAGASIVASYTYPPMYNVPVIADPLGYIQSPSFGGCTNTAPISKLNQPTGTTVYLSPGTYCGSTSATANYVPGPGVNCGMKASTTTPAVDVEGTYFPAGFTGVGCAGQVQGGTGGNCLTRPTLSLSPGLYIFIGGVNFNCVTVTGNAVTMYFTRNSSVGFGQMRMTSSAWNVSAPNDTLSGGIPGISVMSDRAWVGGPQDFQWNYSTWYGDGVVYVTGNGISAFNLSMSGPNYMNIVASNMYNYLGEIRPTNNYSNLLGGNPLHTVVSLVQ